MVGLEPVRRLSGLPLVLFSAVLAMTGSGRSEIIDRVAVVVGDRVVTESEILLQLRVAALLDGEPVNLGAAARRQAAERLIAQTLIRREIELSRYPTPGTAEADAALGGARKDPRLAADEDFASELARYQVSESDVRQQLLWQLTLLRFVEFRFRPALAISDEDLKRYYETQFVPRWKRFVAEAPPSFDDSRAEVESAVAERMLDDALDRWLKQARAQTRIRFREEVFR